MKRLPVRFRRRALGISLSAEWHSARSNFSRLTESPLRTFAVDPSECYTETGQRARMVSSETKSAVRKRGLGVLRLVKDFVDVARGLSVIPRWNQT
jgi:hypothetical protein